MIEIENEDPHKWDRLVIQADIVVDGRRIASRVTVDARAWQDQAVRERVKAELKAHLVEVLLTELKPTIRIFQ